MKRLVLALTAATVLVLSSLAPVAAAPRQSPEQRAADLVAQMTLDEKISQLHTRHCTSSPCHRLTLQRADNVTEGET